ncbi:MAG: hydrogenase iron-sulfur subunit [Planctomycetes bacterium]|nr:hydrogenase iron-sulfur subunit [Planctomycetota bacterium]
MSPTAKGSGVKEAATAEEFDPMVIIFACNWCSYSGADLAGTSRYQYAPNVRIIRVMCSGRVDPSLILKALRNGADGVMVSGCHPADCHYISGNQKAEARVSFLKRFLPHVGIDPRRLSLEWISGSEGELFARTASTFTEEIRELGPNPLTVDDIPEVR